MWKRMRAAMGRTSFTGLLSIIVWKIFEDRLLSWTNGQIDSGSPSVLAKVVRWLDLTPGGFLVSIVVLTALAIVAHAYWTAWRNKRLDVEDDDSQKQPHTGSGDGDSKALLDPMADDPISTINALLPQSMPFHERKKALKVIRFRLQEGLRLESWNADLKKELTAATVELAGAKTEVLRLTSGVETVQSKLAEQAAAATTMDAKLTLATYQIRSLTDENASLKIKVDECEGKNVLLANKYENAWRRARFLDNEFGRFKVRYCGMTDPQSLLLSVDVEFIETKDSGTAKAVHGMFWNEFRRYYRVSEVRQRQWLDNPSSKARIVIYSDHENAQGIRSALNEHELIRIPDQGNELSERHERVEVFGKRTGMQADITIVIFDKVGLIQW